MYFWRGTWSGGGWLTNHDVNYKGISHHQNYAIWKDRIKEFLPLQNVFWDFGLHICQKKSVVSIQCLPNNSWDPSIRSQKLVLIMIFFSTSCQPQIHTKNFGWFQNRRWPEQKKETSGIHSRNAGVKRRIPEATIRIPGEKDIRQGERRRKVGTKDQLLDWWSGFAIIWPNYNISPT